MARTERGATQDTVRRHNLAALLGHLHRHGPTSRARLTRLLGLNRATIGTLVDELVCRRLAIEDAEPERGAQGRPSKVISARADAFMVVAVEIGVDAITVALVSLGGLVIDRDRRLLSNNQDRSFERVVESVSGLAGSLLQRSKGSFTTVAVGVAVPGAVRSRDGLVHFAPNLGWRNVPLAARLQGTIAGDAVVLVGNDANLGAMAEHSRGIASGVNDLVYLHAEAGVGGGIITAGRMLEGATGYGGEVGHMQVNPDGSACHCGARGCWETEVGEDALVRRAGLHPGGRSPAEQVVRRAQAGDPQCLAAVDATAKWISVGLIDLVNSLNPEMLILGGMFEELLDLARPTIVELLQRGIYDAEHQRVELVKPRFGRDAVLIGAAEMALQVILNDPASVPVYDPQNRAPVLPFPTRPESIALSRLDALVPLERR
ncbi:MAG TPA: ROK family protein [Candidatus Dormibacteraeota bacterium]|nr:ROK family protein [Candidatus Dormibacteraeota bacterium]